MRQGAVAQGAHQEARRRGARRGAVRAGGSTRQVARPRGPAGPLVRLALGSSRTVCVMLSRRACGVQVANSPRMLFLPDRPMTSHGYCEPPFQTVKEEFERN